MASISWDETVPSDTESLSQGDDRIRSMKTSLRAGLDAEHVWPSAGGDAGVHRLGSGRAYVGTQSQVSSSGTDGKMFWASDTSQFFHAGSGGTSFIGGPRVITAGGYPGTSPQRHLWVEEFGTGVTDGASGSTSVSIPNSGYSGQPYIFVSGYSVAGGGRPPTFDIQPLGASTFNVRAFDPTFALSVGSANFFWRSIGTRVMP